MIVDTAKNYLVFKSNQTFTKKKTHTENLKRNKKKTEGKKRERKSKAV